MKLQSYNKDNLLYGLILWSIVTTLTTIYLSNQRECPYVWHGGSPKVKGSCWCGGNDAYCLCTPSLAIDAIIEVKNTNHHPSSNNNNLKDKNNNADDDIKIVLIKRRDPPRDVFAIPGGFVDVGESVEAAVIREVKEETNLSLNIQQHVLQQFHVYSDPKRDKRRHTVSAVVRCLVTSEEVTKSLKTGDDAKSVVLMTLAEVLKLPRHQLGFDHYEILHDYIQHYHPHLFGAMVV